MSPLPKTYRFLAGLDDGAVDDALAAGVRELDGPYLRFAVEVLLQRAKPDGLPAVIDCYHRLPADLKERVLASEEAISPLLRTAVRGELLQARLNSLEIASRIGSESLAYLFDLGLMDSQPKVRETAALSMRQMALQLLGEHPLLCGQRAASGGLRATADEERGREEDRGQGAAAGNDDNHGLPEGGATNEGSIYGHGKSMAADNAAMAPSSNKNSHGNDHGPATASDHATRSATAPDCGTRLAQRRHHLFEALLSGAHRYESHLRAEVVEACMWFEPYLGERFWELLGQPRSKLPRLVAEILTGSDEPAAAYLLMQAMSVAELRPQAVKAIGERRDYTWFRAALRGVEIWHPWQRVRRGWNFIKDIAYLYTLDEAGWADLGTKTALPILIAASNSGLQRKALLMERLLGQATGTACRRQILLEACRGKDWGVPILEAALRKSSDPAELRMAAYGLLGVAHEGLVGDLVKRVSAMGNAAPAGLVGLTADLVFWRLWTRFDTMEEDRRVAALAGIRGFAEHIKDRLRVNLASMSTSHRLRAARIAGLLGLVDVLWKDMRLAAQDASPRVRSAAVRFLGRSSRPELREQLLAAVEDPDGRVQANALEAMDEAGWPDLVGLIVPKLHSEHTRVRANAAKALARAGNEEATRLLTEMLEDSRAECRVAAVRAIKQIGAGAWLEKLADLAEKDSSAEVRRQAAAVCVELQGSNKQAGRKQGRGSGDRLQGPADNNDEGAGPGAVPADPQNGNHDNSDDHKDTAQAEAWTPNEAESMAAHNAAMAPGSATTQGHATQSPSVDSAIANDVAVTPNKVSADPAARTSKVSAAGGTGKGRA